MASAVAHQASLLSTRMSFSSCSSLGNKTFGFSGLRRTPVLRQFVRCLSFENTPSSYAQAVYARGFKRASVFPGRNYNTNVVTSRLQIDLAQDTPEYFEGRMTVLHRLRSPWLSLVDARGMWGVHQVPCLVDNYAYLLHDTRAGVTAVVDPSAAGPVIKALKDKGLSLDFILNTHHHWDHTGGNLDLKREYNAQVVGPRADEDRIPGIDISLRDGESWTLGDHVMHVLDTPGHTRGHVSFYFPDSSAVFTGDTLFSMGCGRLFEGSPEQMWSSLMKLLQLPDDTLIYCGHEYTLSNAKFAMSVEPQNQALVSQFEKVAELRRKGIPTIPASLGDEKKCNPFLRPFSQELKKSVNLSNSATDVETFAAVRVAKDRFLSYGYCLGHCGCNHDLNKLRTNARLEEFIYRLRKGWKILSTQSFKDD